MTEGFARRAKLKGQPVLQSLFTTGGKVTEWKTMAYFIPLIDRGGVEHKVLAYSIGSITSPVGKVDLRLALEEFPELNGDYSKISRPTGSVDLLLGIRRQAAPLPCQPEEALPRGPSPTKVEVWVRLSSRWVSLADSGGAPTA